MPLVLLVNPSSAGGSLAEAAAADRVGPRRTPLEFRVLRTRDLEHGVEAALRAVEAGELPVVVSGDGLIGAVGGAMAGAETPLGIIPGGRGNDFARVLGIPTIRNRGRGPRRRPLAADRRRRGERQAVPRDRQRRLRLRSQPGRQRNRALPRQPRLRLRRPPHPGRLEAGAIQVRVDRSGSGSPGTRSRSPTTRPSAAGCSSLPTLSSTMGCSTW